MGSQSFVRKIEKQLPPNYIELWGKRVADLVIDGFMNMHESGMDPLAGVPIDKTLLGMRMSPGAKVVVVRLIPLGMARVSGPIELSEDEFVGIALGPDGRAAVLRTRDELIEHGFLKTGKVGSVILSLWNVIMAPRADESA